MTNEESQQPALPPAAEASSLLKARLSFLMSATAAVGAPSSTAPASSLVELYQDSDTRVEAAEAAGAEFPEL